MPPPPATFGKIKYVSDPYKPAIEVVTHGNSSKGVRQMSGAKGIKTKLNRLYEGERPDIPKGGVKPKRVAECKYLTTDGFKYSSNMKISNNRGDYTSTFTKKYEHIPITKPETEEEVKMRMSNNKKHPTAPKNVSTNPYREGVFNKIPYVTQSVDRVPQRKKKSDDKAGSLSFTKKNDLFSKVPYMAPIITKSKSDGELEKPKDPTILDCGSFRPSSPAINLKSSVPGTFSPCRYASSAFDDRIKRRACTPEKLHPLPAKVRVWVS